MEAKHGKKQIETKDKRITELEMELRNAKEDIIIANEISDTLRKILTAMNNELGSLLNSTDTGAIFLDTQLHIKSATPRIIKHFNIIPNDLGRPITDLVSNLLYDTLVYDVKQVIATSMLKEIVIASKDKRWFNMRILPHSTKNNVIDGVIITITDITNLKKNEEQLRDRGDKLLAAIEKSPVVVWNQDLELRYTWIHNPNSKFRPEETIGKKDEDLVLAEDANILTIIKNKLLETGVGLRKKVRTTLKEKPYYYDMTVEPLLDSKSNTIGISCTSTEISKMEYELK
jgi:two-component system, chemotaxis family, CheB/CheR fusion protein